MIPIITSNRVIHTNCNVSSNNLHSSSPDSYIFGCIASVFIFGFFVLFTIKFVIEDIEHNKKKKNR
jgi:hypothetical protein